MEASIGVSKPTKVELQQAKPGGLPWDDFLIILRNSVDEKKFRKNLADLMDQMEADSLDDATERVLSMRSGKEAGLRLAEAKERLKRQRLARELRKVSEMLTEEPEGRETQKAMRALDVQLHALV